ncbi:hypothetical protein BG452_28785 [Streptomyces sp. CBMA123]|nr:hypothetical protein [Streptomyces sp. CBMA123]
MDLNTVAELRDARLGGAWRPGDAWLGGGTALFSEPQPHIRRRRHRHPVHRPPFLGDLVWQALASRRR